MATIKILGQLIGGTNGRSVFQFVSQNRDTIMRIRRCSPFIQQWNSNPRYTLMLVRSCSSQSDLKKANMQLKAVRGTQILQEAIQKKTDQLKEKKEVFVKDIRDKKSQVQQRVKSKLEEIVERENVLTIPNLLCVTRGLIAPYLGLVVIDGNYTLAMGLLIFAGITDLLDGYIARKWPKQASNAGSFLDPLADKLLVGSLVISLTYCGLMPLWLTGMILFRDIFLIVAGFVIRYVSLPPPKTFSRYFDVTHATAQLEPTFVSKVNTAVQLAAVALSLGAPIWNYVEHEALHGLWYLTGATTIAAAVSYVAQKDTYKILSKASKDMKEELKRKRG